MKWECQYAQKLGGWVVEAVGRDGEVYVTQFYGPDAEARAVEYAEWKNKKWAEQCALAIARAGKAGD